VVQFLINHWRDGVEILLLWMGIYQVYRALRSTRGARMLVALLAIIIFIIMMTNLFELKVIGWILTRSALFIAFSMVVLFQPEIRNALTKLGSSKLFFFSQFHRLEFMEVFSRAVKELSNKRIGALIAFERTISLKDRAETGVLIDGEFSTELAMTIFHPKTSLHDGGMVINQNRIVSAGCVFPVSQKELSDRTLGLRHRAAIGLTEESDAVCVIVSEETGSMSIAVDGTIYKGLSDEEFKKKLELIFTTQEVIDEEDDEKKLGSKDDRSDHSSRDMATD